MARRKTTEEINEILRGDNSRDLYDVLAKLPEDVDAKLAAMHLVDKLEHHSFYAGRNLRKAIPQSVIRAVQMRLPERIAATKDDPYGRAQENLLLVHERIRVCGHDESLQDAWVAALQLMLDIDLTYSWGSKQRKERFRKLASDERACAALRALAVGVDAPRMDVLVVLALEGSEESLDALLPHMAADSAGSLERLEQMRTHIPRDGSTADLLLRDVEDRLAATRENSPALDFGERLGFGRRKEFWFDYSVGSIERSPNGYNPKFRVTVGIDSRSEDWFWVTVHKVEFRSYSTFGRHDAVDQLQLGTCTADELPKWIASVADKLGCQWQEGHLTSGLRGKKRTQLQDWLESGWRDSQG